MTLQTTLQINRQDPGPSGSGLTSSQLKLHHIGVLVKRLDHAIASYRVLGADITEPVIIPSQGVRVCFVDMGTDVAIELVEAMEKGVAYDLLKRGTTYYHLGYIVSAFDDTLGTLSKLGYVHLQTFYSEAFGGRRCAFLMSPVLHLLEIIEHAPLAL